MNGASRPYQQGVQTAELRNDGQVMPAFCDDTQKVDVAPLTDIPPRGSSTFAFGYQVEPRGALELTFGDLISGDKAVFAGK